MRKIFYYYDKYKVEVNIKPTNTLYKVKVGKEYIVFEIAGDDTNETRVKINKEIKKVLCLH